MAAILKNIRLFAMIQSKNETIFKPCIERMQPQLSHDEYQLLSGTPASIEKHIAFFTALDNAIDDLSNMTHSDLEKITQMLEPPDSYSIEYDSVYKRFQPLNKHFSQPELIHFMILFDIGKKLARYYTFIQDVFAIPNDLINRVKENLQ